MPVGAPRTSRRRGRCGCQWRLTVPASGPAVPAARGDTPSTSAILAVGPCSRFPYGRSELGNRKTCSPTDRPATRYPHGQLPAHEVEHRSSERRGLIDELFTSASVGLLGGPPKAFKTWVAADLAVATGTKAFGRFAAPDPGPVLFFGAEDPPPDLRTRFDGIARARRLD